MKVEEVVEIVRLDPNEVDGLVEAQADIFADYIIPFRSSRKFFMDFLRSVGGRIDDIIVAKHQDAIIGYVNPVIDGNEAWIGGLGVVPSFRGQGIGRRLMEAAEEGARLRGVEEIILEVIEGNSAASRLYARLGYTEARKYLSAEGKAAGFAGFGNRPNRVRVEDIVEVHRASYSESCWQRRKAAALEESGRTCEIYSVDGGFVMLRRVETTGFIPFIGVLPQRRSLGIGTSLTKFALNRLWELGAFNIAIYNVNDDLATRRMLDKFDFAVTIKQVEMRKSVATSR
ncbi:MAG: GNAT family N-acetyltransferase [Methanobacteriota archaeon]|nr:MAG: GNAT family N-acetyltransferase [Euryarchaeota archaeon]